MADTYNQTWRIARKDHVCYECGRTISKKEKYQYTFGVWGGDVNTYKTCEHCVVGQKWLWETCGGYLHGGLDEEMREHAEDYRRFDLYRFVVGMRKQWKNMRVPILKD
jgi:hypothetical protein